MDGIELFAKENIAREQIAAVLIANKKRLIKVRSQLGGNMHTGPKT